MQYPELLNFDAFMEDLEHNNLKNNFYLMRHGFSEANEASVIISDLSNGSKAYGLTEKGRSEVFLSISSLGQKGLQSKPFIIYSSPFLRALETASILQSTLKTPLVFSDTRIRERNFGAFEFANADKYQKIWTEDLKNPRHKKWEVESVYEVLERASSLVFESNKVNDDKNIFIITHGDVCQILYVAFSGKDPKNHRSILSFHPGDIRNFTW